MMFLGFFPLALLTFDYINRYHAVQFMCSLMDEGVDLTPPAPANDGDEKTTVGDDDANGSARRYVADEDRRALILDMRQSQNVLAWSLVRRYVACSGEFGHSFCT
jgi:hypothetical protein